VELAKPSEQEEILSYLKADVENCIYLYIDIEKYGLMAPEITVWLERDAEGKINLILMKYYESFQLYSRSSQWDIEGVLDKIILYKTPMVSARAEMAEAVFSHLKNEYRMTIGTIFQLTNYRKTGKTEMVQRATEADVPEIAKLMCEDEYYKDQYLQADLEKQLAQRMRSGMGRNYVIRVDGKIVVHDAIFAETDLLMVASGMIVHRDYRASLLGAIMEDFMINQVGHEGKRLFGFMTEKRRDKLFLAYKNTIVARYGKLVRKDT